MRHKFTSDSRNLFLLSYVAEIAWIWTKEDKATVDSVVNENRLCKGTLSGMISVAMTQSQQRDENSRVWIFKDFNWMVDASSKLHAMIINLLSCRTVPRRDELTLIQTSCRWGSYYQTCMSPITGDCQSWASTWRTSSSFNGAIKKSR